MGTAGTGGFVTLAKVGCGVDGGVGAGGAGDAGQPSSGASSLPSAHCGTPSHALYTAMHSPPCRHSN